MEDKRMNANDRPCWLILFAKHLRFALPLTEVNKQEISRQFHYSIESAIPGDNEYWVLTGPKLKRRAK
jgi:hypothetical protein